MPIDASPADIPSDPDLRRVWIVSLLRARGTSLRRLAAEIGTSHQAVAQALRMPSARIEAAIADALGLPAAALFPERHDRAGRRVPLVRSRQDRPRRRRRHVESARGR